MPRMSKGRVLWALLLLTILAFFLPPLVRVNRFRNRIAHSMEEALGRKGVKVGTVSLRLLPQPGFDLHKLIIPDDPAFGAEPMLRADEVTVTFRLASLWRGRLELARLTLKSGTDINPPSLNLVRGATGHWNIGSLLQRASQTPAAPTAQTRIVDRPRFPYIEAEGGRVNLKIGQEKKVYALTEADFALWLASEDEWGFRLAARAVRTDMNLSDTGLVKVNGRFRRAPNLRDTPVDINVAVQNAQLGALTKLIYGRDRGWRGGVTANAHLSGTPASLDMTAQAAIHDFRRYDIGVVDTLRLQAQCSARYSSITEQVSALDCQMPLGGGLMLLRGDMTGLAKPHAYNLNVAVEHVDVQTLVELARHAKRDLPEDLAAKGDLDAGFTLRKASDNAVTVWSGGGRTSEITLASSVLTPELPLPALGFALEGPGSSHPQRSIAFVSRRKPGPAQPPALRLAFAPFRVPVGGSAAINVSAWFNRTQYEVQLEGDARIQRLLQLGRALGLQAPQYGADGAARVNLEVAGQWTGFTAPRITGQAQLRDISARVRGLNAPLQIGRASLQLGSAVAVAGDLSAHFSGFSLQLTGSVRLPRNCTSLERCPVTFDLQADQVSLDELNRLANPRMAKRSWYNVFPARSSASVLEQVEATGHVNANRLIIRALSARHASAQVELHAGVLTLTDLRAEVLGGKHLGDWRADFTGARPEYSGRGTFTDVAMPELAALMQDDWAAGAVNAKYRVVMSGYAARELGSSVSGNVSFDWQNGILRHLLLDGQPGPLEFKRLTGQMDCHDRVFTIAQSRMTTASGIYQVSGTASLNRQLGLKLRNGGRTYDISGPLDKPKVTSVSAETRAALQK